MRYITLTRGHVAVVDDDDFYKFGQMKWGVGSRSDGKSFYARRSEIGAGGKKRCIYLHRAICGDPVGMVVDHRDGDGLNCCKHNLRVCSQLQNVQNRLGATAKSKSGIRGVSFRRETGKWNAFITINKRHIYLGSFGDKVSAANAYAEANKKHFGEFGGGL